MLLCLYVILGKWHRATAAEYADKYGENERIIYIAPNFSCLLLNYLRATAIFKILNELF